MMTMLRLVVVTVTMTIELLVKLVHFDASPQQKRAPWHKGSMRGRTAFHLDKATRHVLHRPYKRLVSDSQIKDNSLRSTALAPPEVEPAKNTDVPALTMESFRPTNFNLPVFVQSARSLHGFREGTPLQRVRHQKKTK